MSRNSGRFLQSLDDFKSAASELGIKVGKMKKEEIKDAIKAADIELRFVFQKMQLPDCTRQTDSDTDNDAGHSLDPGKHFSSRGCFQATGDTAWLRCPVSGLTTNPAFTASAGLTGL